MGRGQSGGATVPASVPEPLRTQLQQLVHSTFAGSYVDAMRATLVIPVAVLLLCAVCCMLLIRPPRPATALAPVQEQPDEVSGRRN